MANEKILVVDDDTNICELLRLYLTKEGYQVTTANDGEEGLEKFNQLKPDMVLLDVMMPKMDGLEVCRRIRKLGNTPVMMLTAKGETFDKVLGLELGADDYVTGHADGWADWFRCLPADPNFPNDGRYCPPDNPECSSYSSREHPALRSYPACSNHGSCSRRHRLHRSQDCIAEMS